MKWELCDYESLKLEKHRGKVWDINPKRITWSTFRGKSGAEKGFVKHYHQFSILQKKQNLSHKNSL